MLAIIPEQKVGLHPTPKVLKSIQERRLLQTDRASIFMDDDDVGIHKIRNIYLIPISVAKAYRLKQSSISTR